MPQTRGMLDQELAQIQDDIAQIGTMAEQAIQQSLKALKTRDVDLARQIIANDKKINSLRYKIEEQCLTTIATQQPMARDLRTIISALHITTEIERIADHAEGIAEIVTRIAHEPLLKPLIDLPRMADVACEMLRGGLDAFFEHNPDVARTIGARDDEIDQLYDQVLRELLTYMIQDPSNISRATRLLWVAHNLERIGDRAKNISERVIFLATGALKGTKEFEEQE